MNSLAVAEETAIEILEEASIEPTRPGLEALVASFIQAQDVSPGSRATYSRLLKQYIVWLEETGRAGDPWSLRREEILNYKDWLKVSGKTPLSGNSYLTAVRKFYRYLEAERIYPDITRDVKGFRKPHGFNKDCLSREQVKDVLNALHKSSLEGLRDYALVSLMARTGLRDIEVSRAKVSDIRPESGETVLWVQGKGRDSADAFVLVTAAAEKPIRQWLQARGPVPEDAPLFCSLSDRNRGQGLSTRSISRICKEAFRSVGLDSSRLSAHSLRHTAISMALRGGASLQQAQAMARHTDPKTTLVYAHNLSRVQDGAEKYINFD
jgi:integrase/recombinase XerC/integrase/recombinase XerD